MRRGCADIGRGVWDVWKSSEIRVVAASFAAEEESSRGCGSGSSSGSSECVGWARRYMKACVCGVRQEASFALGLLSVVCWGVAEVPQIVTNFREASTEGISLLFLITWVLGDVFNLAGCYLEPSTLPTQFYMALLYTITTLILVGQVVYYDYIVKGKLLREQLVVSRPETKTRPVVEEEQRRATEYPNVDNVLQRREQQVYDIDGSSRQSMRLASSAPVVQSAATQSSSSPIAYARTTSPPFVPGRDGLYYTSARSLASSRTPTAGSYLAVSRSCGGSTSTLYSLLQEHHNAHHPLDRDDDDDDDDVPSHTNNYNSSLTSSSSDNHHQHHPHDYGDAVPTVSIRSSRSAPASTSPATAPPHVHPSVPNNGSTSGVLRGVLSFAMCSSIFGGGVLSTRSGYGSAARSGAGKVHSSSAGPRDVVKFVGRKLLMHEFMLLSGMDTFDDKETNGSGSGSLGVWFGWLMAAIYMGGRVPQIYLNMKRGSVEGLNPLMFTFAVLGNATYVASILVNSTEWKKIKSNMPWLVDAGVCVLLDFFILSQFLYYYSRKPRYRRQDVVVDYKWLE